MDYLESPDGRTRLHLQDDGNLVIYQVNVNPWKVLWNTGTFIDTSSNGPIVTEPTLPLPPLPSPSPLPPPSSSSREGLISDSDDRSSRPIMDDFSFIPDRGAFYFPAPYYTIGIRITNPHDRIILPISYSYWRNINNHKDSHRILVFLNTTGGPQLFEISKSSYTVNKLGPIPIPNGDWYFSATHPNILYYTDGPKMMKYDLNIPTEVFDVSHKFGDDKYIWQTHASNDDKVFSMTLRQSGTWEKLGSLVWKNGDYLYYPQQGELDECQIDKSGTFLLIKEGNDNRIINLESKNEVVLTNRDGAAGHSDNGYGYIVGEDDYHHLPHSIRLWNLKSGDIKDVYHYTDWGVPGPGHISHCNARPDLPIEKQFAVISNASRANYPRSNEIVIITLDGSQRCLVVAPTMTDMSRAGDDYDKMPKGNVDITGEYFIWTCNLGSDRLDAFMVKIPPFSEWRGR